MSYNVKGTIKTISDIETLSNGAKKLSFRIDTGEQFNNLLEFELYKAEKDAEHAENFKKFNNVGDFVNVEFNLRAFNWRPEADNKIFTSLSCWKVTKEGTNEATKEDVADDLPF